MVWVQMACFHSFFRTIHGVLIRCAISYLDNLRWSDDGICFSNFRFAECLVVECTVVLVAVPINHNLVLHNVILVLIQTLICNTNIIL